ncbi:MAG TPA: hypothetical protein DET40_03495 [Lentisphaeria bacterium]|nr:MAG: hypothetical protein A2X45_23335 [Lentisphaerae bacterium GWF2_50_93]HCE42593.1 hypothetical protein [Lentisphaeria bacterium]
MRHTGRAVPIIFATALFLYFYSESVLRQAALSKLKTPKFSSEMILSKLPASIRNSARKSLEIGRLKDAVRDASDDSEKVKAIVNLAMAIDNKKEQERLYREIIKLPQIPESYPAYSYFLLDARPEQTITVQDYQKFIGKCPKESRFDVWNNGLYSLESKNAPANVIKEYLKPLLNEPPPYRDYLSLYEKITDIAFRLGDTAMLEKAGALMEKAIKRPPVFEELAKKNEKQVK